MLYLENFDVEFWSAPEQIRKENILINKLESCEFPISTSIVFNLGLILLFSFDSNQFAEYSNIKYGNLLNQDESKLEEYLLKIKQLLPRDLFMIINRMLCFDPYRRISLENLQEIIASLDYKSLFTNLDGRRLLRR